MASKVWRHYLPELFALGFSRLHPSLVTVNLTRHCNQQCIYCEIGTGLVPTGDDLLTVADLKWIIDEMARHHIPRLALCGGEPFLFKGLADIVAYAGERKIRCFITSNGMTAFSLGETEMGILKSCHARVNISVDSFRDEINTMTRGNPAALTNAIRSIQALSDRGIPVTVLTVVTKFNFRDLSSFIQTADRKGIRQVLFQPVIACSNYPECSPADDKVLLNVPYDEMSALMGQLSEIRRYENHHRIRTNVYRILPWVGSYLKWAPDKGKQMFFREFLKDFYCRDAYAIVDISYDGLIQPCGLLPGSLSVSGAPAEGLLPLWKKATRELHERLEEGDYPPACNACCHHFSRNMIASVIRRPLANRATLFRLFPLITVRLFHSVYKTIFIDHAKR